MVFSLPDKYKRLNEAEVSKALADKNDSQIMQELACLIDLYSKQVARLLQQGGSIEEALNLPTCALEKLALRMVIDAGESDRKEKDATGKL